MIKIAEKNTDQVIEFAFESKGLRPEIITEFGHITFGAANNTGFFFTGKALEATDKVREIATKLVEGIKRDSQVNVTSLLSETEIDSKVFIRELVHAYELKHGKIFTMKTSSPKKVPEVNLLIGSKGADKTLAEAQIVADARTMARNWQITPPNILNSETFADQIAETFAKDPKVKVTVLNKQQIEDNKMGLLLSVNKGSAFEPRVVILEYKGNESSKKTAIVGKGITFDAGGYNIKTGKFMAHMKYDMSGAAIVAASMKAITKLQPNANISGIVVLTDNMISPEASTPDAVFTAMNGKTVEINNTDAEGRLALADGLTYAAKKLKATRLIDIATLTGAVVSALGSTYTGVWSTTEEGWADIDKAAKASNELVWRMPLHSDYLKFMKGSKVADLKNTDLTGKGGSSSAAMFLSNFTEGLEYIHFDVAGTADVNDTPFAPMVRTFVELAKQTKVDKTAVAAKPTPAKPAAKKK